MSIDFLAIGDIVTEPFIRLHEASVHCKINRQDCEICMRWGDKIPYEYDVPMYAVGNSANAAVSAARLGLNAALRAYVGNDENGKKCLDVLTKEKVDAQYMVTEDGKKTNQHYVLWFETERTILVKHEEFNYTLPDIQNVPKWIYLSSLASNSAPYHEQLGVWLQEHPETKLTFQPGTFQMKLGVEALKNIYDRTELFVVNKEEAERILKIEPTDNIRTLLDGLHAFGPKIVIVTNDRFGAYARSAEGKYWFIPMYPDQPEPFERTGAGDAFASSVTAALALGLSFEEALLWGPINAMSVVMKVGAQEGLLSREKLQGYIQTAPAEFKVSELP
jgi:ribokinase